LRWRDQEKVLDGAASLTTNNRMELRGVIAALQALKRSCRVEIYTDSQYLQRGITEWMPTWQQKGWRTARGRAVKNRDLWQALLEAMAPHEVHWHWLRGHAGHPDNERADALARRAAREQASTAPPDLEPPPDGLLILPNHGR
jgi:ribonuclease HI